MKKPTTLRPYQLAKMREILEAQGITVRTNVLTDGINPPDVSGFITGNGESSFVPHDFEGWGPLAMAAAHGFDMRSLASSRPAAIIMTDSAPCAGHSKPLKLSSEADISKLLASMFKPGALRCIKASARTSFRQHVSKERAITARCALARADIKAITTAELDQLLAPYMGAGLVRTAYERSTGATEYRSPTGRLMAMTIGAAHFRPASTGVSESIALYGQTFGRIKRQPRTVHGFLENPLTGEKIKDIAITVGGDQ